MTNQETKLPAKYFDFVGKRKIFFSISLGLIIIGVIFFFAKGFNWDIDFIGGTTMQFHIGQDLKSDNEARNNIASLVEEATGVPVSSTQATGSGFQDIVIKTLTLNTEQRDNAFNAVAQAYGLTENDRLSVENVDPTVGKTLRNSAIAATSIAAILMLLYITIRFELFSGISAVCCLLHDIIIMLSFCCILGLPMNTNVIATILTILGYSINASIINFDRVRENLKLNPKTPFEVNASAGVNQSLRRTAFTTITTLLTITTMYILGVTSVKDFALPIIIGIASSLYSSLFIAAPLWYTLRELLGKKKSKAKA